MNGFIKTAVGLCLLGSVGCCYCLRDLYDPCWPQRYDHQARMAVVETMNAQAHNGHILDQTIWNWHFVRGPKGEPTAVLHPAGLDHLRYLVRRQPCPDPRVFLQTAQDIGYDPANVEAVIEGRGRLDAERQEAVHKFLQFASAGRIGEWQVLVIDPAEVGIAAIPIGGMGQPTSINGAIQQMYGNFRGIMGGAQGSFQSGAPGGSAGGSGNGGGSR
jgi:hypothetical protein